MMTYEQAKAAVIAAELKVKETGNTFKNIPGVGSGLFGITPDTVKETEEYKKARRDNSNAFLELQNANRFLIKNFKKQYDEERKNKRR